MSRLEVRGNTHQEVVDELRMQVNGGYLMDSDYYKRDSFRVIGGRCTATLEHTNPDQTPENFAEELDAWRG